MCCKLLRVDDADFKKDAGKWCKDCSVGSGCKIYDARHAACREFECLWLISQTAPPAMKMPVEFRPDKSKVVLTQVPAGNTVANVSRDAPDSWKRGALGRWLRQEHGRAKVLVSCEGKVTVAKW